MGSRIAHVAGLGFPFLAGRAPEARVRTHMVDSFARCARLACELDTAPVVWESGEAFVAFLPTSGLELLGDPLQADSLSLTMGVRLVWEGDDARLASVEDSGRNIDGRLSVQYVWRLLDTAPAFRRE